ncbi:MAG: DUF4382 domain-containing protein [Gemmatimonadota bacterium]|nr:DUF4382 domain-containing protein [Gemmatimonadota bacterium]
MKRYGTGTLVALVFGGLLGMTACSDTTGPGVGEASVILTSDAVASNSVGEGLSLSIGDVPESSIGNLFLTITRIDLHLVGADEGEAGAEGEGGEEAGEEGGGWISLEVSLTDAVDVLALGAGGIQLAEGTVPAGQYNQARFFFDTSELVLTEDIDVNGTTVVAGSYDVFVPSAAQTGLKLQLSGVEVEDGGTETVGVELGTGATVGTLVRTANGFLLSPVLLTN